MFHPQEQSLLLARLTQQAQEAQRALVLVKDPARSWLAKAHDALVETSEEQAQEAAQSALDACIDSIVDQAPQWIEASIQSAIAASAEPVATDLLRLRADLQRSALRMHAVKEVLALSRTAMEELRDAVAQCSAASSGSLFDAMSSLPRSRQMSKNEGEEAAYAVNKARSALQRLGHELERIQQDEGEASAWWKQVEDCDIPAFFGSAIVALDHSQDSCQRALAKVEELVATLAAEDLRAQAEFANQQAPYVVLEAPFRQRVLANLPENLRTLLVDRGLGLMPSFKPVRRRGLLDFDAVRKARG